MGGGGNGWWEIKAYYFRGGGKEPDQVEIHPETKGNIFKYNLKISKVMEKCMVQKPFFIVEKGEIPQMPLKSWILAMIRDKDQVRPRDAISIMYEAFIFSKEILSPIESQFEFKSSNQGPYSEKVTLSVKGLLSSNMLKTKKDESTVGGLNGYVLTDNGNKEADKTFHKLPEAMRDKIEFMNFITGKMGLTGMLQYIYSIYPEYVYLREGGEDFV